MNLINSMGPSAATRDEAANAMNPALKPPASAAQNTQATQGTQPVPLLTPDECRVLGVLIEKELTVPETYPLSLNALTNGCNQKNNRDPVAQFEEERVRDAVGQLRAEGLALRVDPAESGVRKYKHQM